MEPRPIPPSEAPEASEAGIQWYHIAGGVVGAVGLLAGVGWFAKKMQEIDTPKTKKQPIRREEPLGSRTPDPTPSRLQFGAAPRPSAPSSSSREPIASPVPPTPYSAPTDASFLNMTPVLSPQSTNLKRAEFKGDGAAKKTVAPPATPTPNNTPVGSLDIPVAPWPKFEINDDLDDEDEEVDKSSIDRHLENMLEETLQMHMDEEGDEDGDEEEEEEDDDEEGADELMEPMELTSELLLWGKEPMLNGQIERGVCLPAGDDLVVLIFAPEPVQVTYFSFIPHLEEPVEGYFQAFEREPTENDIKSVSSKPSFVFNMSSSMLAVAQQCDPWLKGQFFVIRLRNIKPLMHDSLGSIGEVSIQGFPSSMRVPYRKLELDPFKVAAVKGKLVEYSKEEVVHMVMLRSLVLLQGEGDEAKEQFESAKNLLATIAESGAYAEKVPVMFHCKDPKDNLVLREMIANKSNKTLLSVLSFYKSYPFPADKEITSDSIKEFLDTFDAAIAPVPYSRLIRHPANPDLFFVQSREFDENIVKADMEYLVGCYPGTPDLEVYLGSLLGDLASVFAQNKVEGIRVAYLDPIGSIPPPQYFPKRYDVSFALFSKGNVFKFDKEPTLGNLIHFIAANSQIKFDADELTSKASAFALKSLKIADSDIHLEDMLSHATKEKKMALVFFTSKNSSPQSHAAFQTFLARLSQEEQSISFIQADVEAMPSSARKYNVRGIPTFILFIDGTPMDGVTGEDPNALLMLLQKWLAAPPQ